MYRPNLLTAISLVALSACETQTPPNMTPISQAVSASANPVLPVHDIRAAWNEGNSGVVQRGSRPSPVADATQQPVFRHGDELRRAGLKVDDEGVVKPTGSLGEPRVAAAALTPELSQRRAQYLKDLDTWKREAGNPSDDEIRLNAAKIKARVLLGEAQ